MSPKIVKTGFLMSFYFHTLYQLAEWYPTLKQNYYQTSSNHSCWTR